MDQPSTEFPSRPAAAASAITSPATGWFRFWFASRRWEWSEQVYRMHGYQPGQVEPTTELLLSHKHPDDRDHVAEAIARSVDQGTPFSSRHRFLDTGGVVHHVMVVADRVLDDSGAPVGTAGFYIDLGDTMAEERQHALAALLPELVEARAVIEQAKGMVMRIYGIDAAKAFALLVWRSQETNSKLKDLAAALIDAAPELPQPSATVVAAFDHLLLTVHERIGSPRARAVRDSQSATAE